MDETVKNSLLIVDDDTSNLMALTRILQSEYTVYTAKDGATALKNAEKHVPDLIVLDILMPGMDGYEVLAALQASDRLGEIPVIFITGLSHRDDEEKGLALGAMDYITKPFQPTIVKLRVRHQMKIVNQLRMIKRMSLIDQLTAIPNRRSFDDRLRMEWARAIRIGCPMSLLMIDVDRFKAYNDTYGHLQGDVALQMLAKILAQQIERPGDFFARWGGEEFAVLLPHTDRRGGLHIGEQIRRAVENAVIPRPDGLSTQVTASVGVNVHAPTQDSSVEAFISGADKALYAAKNAGRNRVLLYDGAAAAP
ncbi:MAG: diguanylate cyclase [Deltaproteobacteria bacterium]|jgi:diguanylate cyclase (GGDEF)-like protein|nr:diguanylate cyclase [Deltaproteobacteria bacterium]